MPREPSSIRCSKGAAHLQRTSPYRHCTSLSTSLDEHSDEPLFTPKKSFLLPARTPPSSPPPLTHSPTPTPCTSAESSPTRQRSESPLSRLPLIPDPEHIRRPANPFILFACHYRKGHKGKNNRDLSREAGAMWKDLPAAEKETWKKLAADVKAKHAEDHPNYRYKPRRRETTRRRIRFEDDIKKSRNRSTERTLDLSSPCSSTECSPVRGRGRRLTFMPEDDDFDALPSSPTKGTEDFKGPELTFSLPGWVPGPGPSSSRTPASSPKRPPTRLPKLEGEDRDTRKIENDAFNTMFHVPYYYSLDTPQRTQHAVSNPYYSSESQISPYNPSLSLHPPAFNSIMDFVYPPPETNSTTVLAHCGHVPRLQVYPDAGAFYGSALGLTDGSLFPQPQPDPGLPTSAEQAFHTNAYPFGL